MNAAVTLFLVIWIHVYEANTLFLFIWIHVCEANTLYLIPVFHYNLIFNQICNLVHLCFIVLLLDFCFHPLPWAEGSGWASGSHKMLANGTSYYSPVPAHPHCCHHHGLPASFLGRKQKSFHHVTQQLCLSASTPSIIHRDQVSQHCVACPHYLPIKLQVMGKKTFGWCQFTLFVAVLIFPPTSVC